MRRSPPLCLLALAASLTLAQLPDGSLAPDFVATDINGHARHLYDLLDSGYTVLLEFSSAWCSPCWTYHESGELENFYTTYGPGTPEDRVRVFSIESEPTNSTAQLHFRLTLDHFCNETTWKLFNGAGTVLEQGGPYNCYEGSGGGPDAEATHAYNWQLPADRYILEVYDALGDGLASSYVSSAFTDGSWRLFDTAGDTLFAGGGNFGLLARGGFKTVGPASIAEDALGVALDVFPNPTSGEVWLRGVNGAPLTVAVYDAVGRRVLVRSGQGGGNAERLDLRTARRHVFPACIGQQRRGRAYDLVTEIGAPIPDEKPHWHCIPLPKQDCRQGIGTSGIPRMKGGDRAIIRQPG